MAITAKKLENRDIYEISYENSTGEGTVIAKFHNQENGDKSSKVAVDDGTLDVTVAAGWSGTDDVTITHENGDVLDQDVVDFG
jgi:hypothetical protein